MVNIKGYALSDKPIFFTLSRIMDSDFWSSYLVVPGLEVSRLGTGCKNNEPDDGSNTCYNIDSNGRLARTWH